MSYGEGREMTLEEWVNRLPKDHSARFEYEMLTHVKRPTTLERIADALAVIAVAATAREARESAPRSLPPAPDTVPGFYNT